MDWQCGGHAAVVHAAKMPTRYILARENMQVQCDGAMADVKMLPAFTAKRSPGCFSDILHDILEGNPRYVPGGGTAQWRRLGAPI